MNGCRGWRSAGLAAALSLLLAGCTNAGSIAGAVTGAASGSGTANPALGYAVGIGTKAAVDSLSRTIARKRQQAEQDRIADAVGTLAVGQGTPWEIRHKIPLGNQHGFVTVVRDIPNVLAPCKEVVFTVLVGKADTRRGYYLTTACQRGDHWKWAQAEPATRRWGFLQ
ncbi:hypothetical protein [Sphingomonas sp.]|uniref:hypothetical protein n=1 Tax=Sphingomonas sp. TaxID=28214 RepID=UPI003AFF6144